MTLHNEKEGQPVSKASDHPKAVEATRLLRELAHEYELATTIAADQKDRAGEKAHRHAANRFWNAIDSVSRA